MKLWEINQRKCIENIKMSNTVHKNIYVKITHILFNKKFLITIQFEIEFKNQWNLHSFVLYWKLY